MEEGRGVTFLLPVALVLCFAKLGIGGALEGGVQGSEGKEENKGLSSLSGTLVVATTE